MSTEICFFFGGGGGGDAALRYISVTSDVIFKGFFRTKFSLMSLHLILQYLIVY